ATMQDAHKAMSRQNFVENWGCDQIARSLCCTPRQGERPLAFGMRLAIITIWSATRLMED
ncbi:MAG: hypothetical protein ABL860_08575, partial [Candidatus Nitrotoga sp.]